MIDLGTFGKTPAAIRLAELINEDNINYSKLGLMLSSFSRTLKELKKIDSRIALSLAKSLYVYNKNKSLTKYHQKINTYIVNVLKSIYNKFLEDMKHNIPYKKDKIKINDRI